MTGSELKALREGKYSQEKMAELLDVSTRTLIRAEQEDEVVGWLMYAYAYLCGHVMLVKVEKEQKQPRGKTVMPTTKLKVGQKGGPVVTVNEPWFKS